MTLRLATLEQIYLCCPFPEDQTNSVSYVRAISPEMAARQWCIVHPVEAAEPRILYVRLGHDGARRMFKMHFEPKVEAL